jgi:translation elongation factor P/translation initiation factor 5A
MKEIEIGEIVKIGDETFEVIGDDSPTLTKIEMFEVGDYIWNGFRYLQICRIDDRTVVLIEPKDGYFYLNDKYTTEKDVFRLHEIKEMVEFIHDVRKATVSEVYEDIIKSRSC